MKVLLLFILCHITCFSAYSQTHIPKQLKFYHRNYTFDQGGHFYQTPDSMSKNSPFSDTLFNKKIEPGNEIPLYNRDEIQIFQNPETIYSMRIVKPEGNFPMRVYIPDSTKNYSLLIKEF